ncbi:transposase [Bradyrhizobium sp. USDA 4538]|nr:MULTISPECIES: IS66 family transposase [unclassified Bradyrhizobium]MCP1838626.1 transposase [Bradyrhizobium sp. USDA 4538]MCP1899191.1 transposase [Bradyrhizobium sp. USDA 4537]MCP1986697.1 transposase [Bradyrhizobium sp. USDA 4539]
MAIRPDTLPTDPAALTEMVLALDAENETLRVAMQTFKDMIFGKRSERLAALVAEQLALELGDLETDVTPPAAANDDAAAAKPPGKPLRKKARRNIGALPKHLPRCEHVLEPEATACPCCQGQLHKIGEDVSEVLDIIPAILRVLRTVRPKYGCRRCTDGVIQAKVLPRLIESGMASTALVSHVVVSKFAWYLPLYRQVQILAGQGVHLDRATLAGWVKRAAWWLRSLYALQLRTIQAAPRLFCDETPMPVLDPGRHRPRICQFWAHAMDDRPWGGPSPPAVAYVFADGRGTAEIARQLMGFSGILQVDGYAAYKALARDHGGAIQLAFCLAHARRKFVEVYKTTQSPFAREVIERLQAVYAIEAEIRGSSVGEPDPIRSRRREVAHDQVRYDRQVMTAVGGANPAWWRHDGSDAMPLHHPLDPATAGAASLRRQSGMDSPTAIAPATVLIDLPDLSQQRGIGLCPFAHRSRAPSVIAGRRDLEHLTYQTNRIHVAVILDEAEAHVRVPAKIAIDFFKMSRSMRSRSFSWRSRAISAAWSADIGVACVVGRHAADVGS